MKLKKFAAILVAIAVCTTLTACGGIRNTETTKHTSMATKTTSTSESKSDEELTTTTVDIETTDDTTMLITEESKITETQENTLVESTIAESDKPTAETLKGIRPEFKEALDSYEAFYDEYCDIMKKYMENPLDMSILTEYYECIEKIEEMDEKLEALDDSEWSDEETKYYLEVTTRVTTKMLEIYQ